MKNFKKEASAMDYGKLVGALVAALLIGSLTSVSAHHRPGHDHGPPSPQSGGNVFIDLINCDDNSIAKWKGSSTLTFRIDNASGAGDDVIQAVREGTLRWNAVPNPYDLVETTGSADIAIGVYNKVVPGYILGFTAVTCASGSTGIESAEIALGVNGLSLTGVENLTAHEVGHGLGLGHTDSLADSMGDLMGARFEQREEGKQKVCPSNLDTGGLTSSGDPYVIPAADWQQHAC
jgi:hypothetical protein